MVACVVAVVCHCNVLVLCLFLVVVVCGASRGVFVLGRRLVFVRLFLSVLACLKLWGVGRVGFYGLYIGSIFFGI